MDQPIFDQFFELLLILEGKYVDNKNDKGRKTNYGITEKTLDTFNDKFNKTYKIKDLTKEQAKEIYESLFFKSVKPTVPIPSYYHYFDLCVNSGYGDYYQCLVETKSDIRKIIAWRKKKYQMIVSKDPSQSVFLKGWYNRINRINEYFKINII